MVASDEGRTAAQDARAEQVAEFTRAFVRALNRTGYYTPEHPEYPRARQGLHEAFGRLMRDQPEIAYVVGPPVVRDGLPEIYVDGAGPQRLELRKLFSPGTWTAFAPSLVEYLARRNIVMLALRAGMPPEEFGAFLDIMVEAPTGLPPPDEGERLARTLLERGLLHVSVVLDTDVVGGDPSMPWQVRLALARLTRDLRTIPLLRRATAEDLRRVRLQLVSDVARPLAYSTELLHRLLLYAPLVQERAEAIVELRGLRILNLLVDGLPHASLLGAGRVALGAIEPGPSARDERNLSVVVLVAARLLAEDATREGDRLLREMCARDVVPFERLPLDLQEWIMAERWVGLLATDPCAAPPALVRPLRVMEKALRLALAGGRLGAAAMALRRIADLDRATAARSLDAEAVRALVSALPAEHDARTMVVGMVAAGGAAAARVVAETVRGDAGKVRRNAAWVLAELDDHGPAAALAALQAGAKDEEAAFLLLACVGQRVDAEEASTLGAYSRHASPRVRREALAALVAAGPAGAEPHVVRALDDPDPSVRTRALLLAAMPGVDRRRILSHVRRLLERGGGTVEMARASLAVVERAQADGALAPADAEVSLCRFVAPVGWIGRALGRRSAPPDLLAAACQPLARLRTERARRALETLRRSRDPRVAAAATAALGAGH